MALDIYLKSVYAGIFNSTMIGRSIGRTLKEHNRTFKEFKKTTFKLSEYLIERLENNTLCNEDIISALDQLVNKFCISYGQAQKGINVILKYHYQLFKKCKNLNGEVLHCPIDSTVLKKLNEKKLPLNKIVKEEYLFLQNQITKEQRKKKSIPVDFDECYERDYLQRTGWEV